MKKVFTLILGLMLSMMTFAQKTVAVYVTASEGVPQETKRILGSELVAAITRNPDYVAIERTEEFLSQVSQEQGQYNNIDDTKLFELGQKYGASNVCVAEITKFGDEYYIVSRLLDIRTQRVWKTARKYSALKSLKELIEVSESLADDLIGNTKEFSTYAYGDNGGNESYIVKIVNRDSYTIVNMKYISVNPTARIGINRGTYIEDVDTREKYYLVDASNISIMDSNNKRYTSIGKGIWEYSFIFNRISENTKNIMIIEPNGWAYKDIVLKPYGDENTFVFEDNTQNIYDEWQKKQEKYVGELQLEDGLYVGEIMNGKPNGKGTLYYHSHDINTKYRWEGDWEDGELNGYAIIIAESGRYEGGIKNGMPEGQGTLITNTGDKIVGAFKNGLPNGRCTLYSEEYGGTIYCNLVNNQMDGEVVLQYKNGTTKRATFSNGKQISDWK
ncbi:MAG: hypothetical protein IK004_04240 [Bacteroidales bacterium]|nr:hypothetical protein [Bacteroidales bacterium]